MVRASQNLSARVGRSSIYYCEQYSISITLLRTKLLATQNKVSLSYHIMCGPYSLAVIFAAIIC